jgi:hypothetical protein
MTRVTWHRFKLVNRKMMTATLCVVLPLLSLRADENMQVLAWATLVVITGSVTAHVPFYEPQALQGDPNTDWSLEEPWELPLSEAEGEGRVFLVKLLQIRILRSPPPPHPPHPPKCVTIPILTYMQVGRQTWLSVAPSALH